MQTVNTLVESFINRFISFTVLHAKCVEKEAIRMTNILIEPLTAVLKQFTQMHSIDTVYLMCLFCLFLLRPMSVAFSHHHCTSLQTMRMYQIRALACVMCISKKLVVVLRNLFIGCHVQNSAYWAWIP